MNPIHKCTLSKKDVGSGRSCLTPGCSCTSGAPLAPGATKHCICSPGDTRCFTLVWLQQGLHSPDDVNIVQAPGPSSGRRPMRCAGALRPSSRRCGHSPIVGGRRSRAGGQWLNAGEGGWRGGVLTTYFVLLIHWSLSTSIVQCKTIVSLFMLITIIDQFITPPSISGFTPTLLSTPNAKHSFR